MLALSLTLAALAQDTQPPPGIPAFDFESGDNETWYLFGHRAEVSTAAPGFGTFHAALGVNPDATALDQAGMYTNYPDVPAEPPFVEFSLYVPEDDPLTGDTRVEITFEHYDAEGAYLGGPIDTIYTASDAAGVWVPVRYDDVAIAGTALLRVTLLLTTPTGEGTGAVYLDTPAPEPEDTDAADTDAADTDAADTDPVEDGPGADDAEADGCGCDTPRASAWALGLLALGLRRRRVRAATAAPSGPSSR
jgi:hypothetical protein